MSYRVEVAILNDWARMPSRGHVDDAGLDLYVSERVVVPSGSFRDVPTGVAVAMPTDLWGMLTGRSSTLRQRGLLVVQGVIDPGYRGELFSAVWNLGPSTQVIEPGDRLAQLVLLPNATVATELAEVPADQMTEGTRGSRGFGSTGA